MLVEFGKADPLQKGRQQPEKVRQVLDKVKTDGLMPAIESVRNKLGQPLPLRHCNVSRVPEAERGVHGFAIGDGVASNGEHAEIVAVLTSLCATVPDTVTEKRRPSWACPA